MVPSERDGNQGVEARWRIAGATTVAAIVLGASLLAPARAMAEDGPDQRVLVYDWVRQALVDERGGVIAAPSDIDRRTSVTVRVRSFNYFRYVPRLQLQEETLEAYAFLDGLWRGLLRLDPAVLAELMADRRGFATEATDDFEGRYDEVRYILFRIGWLLRERMREHTGVGLTWSPDLARFRVFPDELPGADCGPDEAGGCTIGLQALAADLAAAKDRLDRFVIAHRDDSDLVSRTNLNRYFALADEHAALLESVAAFETALDYIRSGRPFVIGARPAGTRVTATLVPSTEDGAEAGAPSSFTYVVESELPTVFSVGYLASGLHDVSLDKLRLGGNDVFQLQSDAATSHDLAAFLSLRPKWGRLREDGSAALLLTLGTSLSDPGARLALGPSLLIDRWLVTAGVVTGNEKAPREPVDPADAEGVARLFRGVAESRRWSWFVSVSLAPFR